MVPNQAQCDVFPTIHESKFLTLPTQSNLKGTTSSLEGPLTHPLKGWYAQKQYQYARQGKQALQTQQDIFLTTFSTQIQPNFTNHHVQLQHHHHHHVHGDV